MTDELDDRTKALIEERHKVLPAVQPKVGMAVMAWSIDAETTLFGRIVAVNEQGVTIQTTLEGTTDQDGHEFFAPWNEGVYILACNGRTIHGPRRTPFDDHRMRGMYVAEPAPESERPHAG